MKYRKKNGDLKAKIDEAKRSVKTFQESLILDWITQATNALKHLHSDKVNVIHRDIKPA